MRCYFISVPRSVVRMNVCKQTDKGRNVPGGTMASTDPSDVPLVLQRPGKTTKPAIFETRKPSCDQKSHRPPRTSEVSLKDTA